MSQNQALNALVFLYKEVLKVELEGIEAKRAKHSPRLPARPPTDLANPLRLLGGADDGGDGGTAEGGERRGRAGVQAPLWMRAAAGGGAGAGSPIDLPPFVPGAAASADQGRGPEWR